MIRHADEHRNITAICFHNIHIQNVFLKSEEAFLFLQDQKLFTDAIFMNGIYIITSVI